MMGDGAAVEAVDGPGGSAQTARGEASCTTAKLKSSP